MRAQSRAVAKGASGDSCCICNSSAAVAQLPWLWAAGDVQLRHWPATVAEITMQQEQHRGTWRPSEVETF
jgi:hypothetical protein